jgi:hypothetical protein
MLESRKYIVSNKNEVKETVYALGYYSSTCLEEIRRWLDAEQYSYDKHTMTKDEALSNERKKLLVNFVDKDTVNKVVDYHGLTLEQLYVTMIDFEKKINVDTYSSNKLYTTELEDLSFYALEVIRGIEGALNMRDVLLGAMSDDNQCKDINDVELYLSDAIGSTIEEK